MVHRDGMIFVEQGSASSSEFARDASWIVHKDIYFEGYTSFESVYRPGRKASFLIKYHSWLGYNEASKIIKSERAKRASFWYWMCEEVTNPVLCG